MTNKKNKIIRAMRKQLMLPLITYINKHQLPQKKAAKLFKIHQPRISDLMQQKVEQFNIETLVQMLAKVNIIVRIDCK